eukprot:1265087-Heterocapsa_arctica.AAC.1
MVVRKWGGSENGGSEMRWFRNWVVQKLKVQNATSRTTPLRPAKTQLRPEQLHYVPNKSETTT